jgi:hypothetical protein
MLNKNCDIEFLTFGSLLTKSMDEDEGERLRPCYYGWALTRKHTSDCDYMLPKGAQFP